MSVFDNMAYGLRIRGLSKSDIAERVQRAAGILELEPLLTRTPRQLSGGQRQRVAMGRAIVREPAVFLFDEPLSNLDAKLRVQMRFEIQKLHRRLATTSLYVTHDQVEAMTLAQRMIVMNAGRAEQIGTPMEVYRNPQTMFVAGFIGSPAMNFMPGKVVGDGRIALDHGGEARSSPIALESGRPVTVGIRPEHFVPCGAQDAIVSGPVELVEQLGADALVHIGHGDQTVIARVSHGTSPTVGSTFCATADPARVFAFDSSTGARLP
jgi:sn-glycerol 3-phosphate transport system ATP-binding protein